MAESLTVTSVTRGLGYSGNARRKVRRMKLAWVSSAAGGVSQSFYCPGGLLIKIVSVPAGGGSAPTDDYDISITEDETGIDVLEGTGADRDTANAESVYPLESGAPISVFLFPGDHTLVVSNAGDTKSGDLYLYLVEPN